MTTCSYVLGQVHITAGWPPRVLKQGISHLTEIRYKCPPKTQSCKQLGSRVGWRTICLSRGLGVAAASASASASASATASAAGNNSIMKLMMDEVVDRVGKDHPNTIEGGWTFIVAELDPATAKVAIGILGPFLSAFAFLFILRIIMSWYPKLPVGKFPYVMAYAPTEPFLIPTRKLIPPLGGVDVTPVVWFGFISFLNEILVGPQGLLVLLSQQVS